jgi:hypothetical protein
MLRSLLAIILLIIPLSAKADQPTIEEMLSYCITAISTGDPMNSKLPVNSAANEHGAALTTDKEFGFSLSKTDGWYCDVYGGTPAKMFKAALSFTETADIRKIEDLVMVDEDSFVLFFCIDNTSAAIIVNEPLSEVMGAGMLVMRQFRRNDPGCP